MCFIPTVPIEFVFFSFFFFLSFFLCREVSEHTRPKRKPAKTVPSSLSVEFVSQGRCASAWQCFCFANNQANIQRPKRKRADTVPFGYSVEFVSQGRCASAWQCIFLQIIKRAYKGPSASVQRQSPLVTLLSLWVREDAILLNVTKKKEAQACLAHIWYTCGRDQSA